MPVASAVLSWNQPGDDYLQGSPSLRSLTFGCFRREAAGSNLDQVSLLGHRPGARTSAPGRSGPSRPVFAVAAPPNGVGTAERGARLRSFRPVVAPCPEQKNNLRLTAEFMNMNTKSKLVLSLGLLVAPLALLAKSPETAYVESYHGRTDIPVPISVIMPEVESRFAGRQVTLEFVVDATGKPVQIAPASPGADADLVTAVTAAIAQWKFSPALVNGVPVARKVALPVMIVDYLDNPARYALK